LCPPGYLSVQRLREERRSRIKGHDRLTSSTVFRTECKLAFGLLAVERDPVSNTPASTQCCFCFHFGREKRPAASVSGKKRDANSNNKSFKSAWRTDQFEQHFPCGQFGARVPLICVNCILRVVLDRSIGEAWSHNRLDDAWRPLRLRFPLLKQLCGRLASVFCLSRNCYG
jgi:hypothetical protein